MEKKSKRIIILLLLMVLLESTFIILLSLQKAAETKEKLNLRLQLKDVSQNLATKESQTKELEKKLEDLEKVKSELKAQTDELTATQKIVEAKMEAARETTKEFAQQFQRQQEDIFKQIKNFTLESRKTQLTLIAKIETLIETKHDLEKQLAKLQEERNSQEDTQPATTEIPLGKINVQQQRKIPEPASPTAGTVLSVDNTYNFAIIDLGKESGIKVKDRLLILRQEKKIGEVEVKEVYRNMSLADIIPDKTLGTLRKNDKVIPVPSE